MCDSQQGWVLKEALKPVITSMASDGIVSILIDKKEYIYAIDTGHYSYIKGLFNFMPWKGVNFLKDNCRWGGKGVMPEPLK